MGVTDRSISLSLLVDKLNNRVLFAEVENDFVDVLLSFLTLPIGTLVRLLTKHSDQQPTLLGCMNNLYKSVENLDLHYFHNETSKTMLLSPRNSSVNECKRLKVNIDDTEHTKYYMCACSDQKHVSTFAKSQCSSGTILNVVSPDSTIDDQNSNKDDQVFIQHEASFLVTDDLKIIPMSTEATYDLLNNLGIQATNVLQKKYIIISSDEVLGILKNALYNTKTLTSTFLMEHQDCFRLSVPSLTGSIYTTAREETSDVKNISIAIIYRKSTQTPLHAEAGLDFINFLFSMLSFPLGAIVKLMNQAPSLGSVTNLYKSVEQLSVENYIKSEDHKAKLVSPKLALQYGCKDQLLDIMEVEHPLLYYNYCPGSITLSARKLYEHSSTSNDGKASLNAYLMPLANFVKGQKTFMVTDDLTVTPFSLFASIALLGQLKIPISDIETRIVNIGQKEALQILESAMTSDSVFTSIISCATLKTPKQEKC